MCNRPIDSGDPYEAYVWLDELGRFRVTKYHMYCPEDFWKEVEDTVRRDEEMDKELEASREWAAAA